MKENLTESEINEELRQFTGSFHYYKASILYNLNLTDGIQFLRTKLNCFWLIDIVGSVQHKDKIKENKEFIVWRIVKTGSKAIVSAYRDSPFTKENLLYKQELEYTDFPLKEFEFYQNGEVLLLKSEY